VSPEPAALPEPASSPAVAAWTEVLERLEDDLRAALAAGKASEDASAASPSHRSSRWTPPAGLGPLPAELRDRAERLAEAQRHTAHYLRDQRDTTARHLAAVRSVPPAEADRPSVYFDLLG
jgi:hypothetical protein